MLQVMQAASAALVGHGAQARRARVRLIGQAYRRERDLPTLLPQHFASSMKPGAPIRGEWLNAEARPVMQYIVMHIGRALKRAGHPTADMRLDALRGALYGELLRARRG